jgi:hypothetical protein
MVYLRSCICYRDLGNPTTAEGGNAMGGINMPRVLLGGLVAAIVVFVLEGFASIFYMDTMTAALEAHDLSMEVSTKGFLIGTVASLISGFVAVFLYAAARPRFGAGPKTAVIVACLFWLGGYFVSVLGYEMLGLFPRSMLVQWGLIGLVELILGTLAGAWIYKEAESA